MATESRDRLHAAYIRKLSSISGKASPRGPQGTGHAVPKNSRNQKDSYAYFEVSLARALLAAHAAGRLQPASHSRDSLQKPHGHERVGPEYFLAQVSRKKLASQPTPSFPAWRRRPSPNWSFPPRPPRPDYRGHLRSARGYVLFAQGDFANAAEQLASDPHSPLSLHHLAVAQEKIGDNEGAQSTRKRLKYLRAPTVEWFLVTHSSDSDSD